MNSKIVIFYHLLQVPGWEFLYQQQIWRLCSSGLMAQAEFIYIGINGKEPLFYMPPRAKVVYNTVSTSEHDTLKAIEKFAGETTENYKILYFHSKGITRYNLNTQAWRLYMEHCLIQNWADCTKLLDEFDCVGTSYREDTYVGWYPHFSGNFWWANTDYLKKLDTTYLSPSPQQIREIQEFWICSNFKKNNPKIKNFFDTGEGGSFYYKLQVPDNYIDVSLDRHQ